MSGTLFGGRNRRVPGLDEWDQSVTAELTFKEPESAYCKGTCSDKRATCGIFSSLRV